MSSFSFFTTATVAPWETTVDLTTPLGLTGIRGFGWVQPYACSDGSFLLLRLQSAAITDIVHAWSADITQTGSWIQSSLTPAGVSQGGANLPLVTLTDYLATPGATSAGAAAMLMQGDDSFVGTAGNESFLGGAGINTVDYGASAGAVHVDLAAGTATGEGMDTLVSIQAVRGSAFGDALTGDGVANLLMGQGGADSLSGGAGNDTLLGGAAADQLAGGLGADVFRYGSAAEGGDRILGYLGTADQIEISAAGFGLVAGMDLVATGHYAASKAGMAKGFAPQFVYNTTTHQLLWDDDGRGADTAVLIADLTGAKGWSGAEITVIA